MPDFGSESVKVDAARLYHRPPGCIDSLSSLHEDAELLEQTSAQNERTGSLHETRCEVLPPSGDDVARATILIVAREPSVRSVTRRILERQSFRTLEARNAREAIAMIHEQSREVDGAILDLGMPEAGADRVAGELRRALPALPILFTGSYGDDSSPKRMTPDPTTGFLATPFGLDALAEKAGALFGARSAHAGQPGR